MKLLDHGGSYNGPKSGPYNGSAEVEHRNKCITNPDRTVITRVRFMVLVENGVIARARQEVFGDPITMEAAAFIVQEVLSKDPETIRNTVSGKYLAAKLNFPDPDKTPVSHGCNTVAEAVVKAIENYELTAKQ